MGFHRQPLLLRVSGFGFFLLLAGPAASASPAEDQGACDGSGCLVVDYDAALETEVDLVVEALGRKLAAHGVRVIKEEGNRRLRAADPPEGAAPAKRTPWVASLREISPHWLMLTVTSPDPSVRESVVRDFRRGESPAETARTVTLVIDEAVLPYLAKDAAREPLGAGLAIIEPPEVGGIKASREPEKQAFPRLRYIEIGLGGCYLPAADDIIAGPRLRIEGAAAARTTVAAGVGWAGSATFGAEGVTGTTSSVPIEATIGLLLLPGTAAELSLSGGFSMGFTIYRTADGNDHRTDILFDPWLILGLRAILRIHGPWSVAVDGGAALVLIRDELVGRGGTVFLQDWILPRLGLALQLWL